MPEIKFGTDGWRGFIADDFTFDNVRRVSGAIAGYVLKHEDAGKGVVVGYDTRFLSRRFAEAASEVLAAAGSRDYFGAGTALPASRWSKLRMALKTRK